MNRHCKKHIQLFCNRVPRRHFLEQTLGHTRYPVDVAQGGLELKRVAWGFGAMQTAIITLSVTNELAGAIIGPKGSTLSAIREHTGTRCGVESTPTPHGERLVTVSSNSAENIVAGVEAVIEALFSAQRPPSTLSFLVHPNAVGALIGKAGSTINQIRAQSNAEVRVHDSGARVLNTYARCDVFSTDKQAIISAALQVIGRTSK